MAKPDTNKLQRMTDIDFSNPDNHVAIVDKGANGKDKFLAVKALEPNTPFEEIEASATAMVNMPLTTLLETLGVWYWDAVQISAAIEKNANVDITEKGQLADLVKSLGSPSTGAPEVTDSDDKHTEESPISKSETEETSMSDDVNKDEAPVLDETVQAAINKAVGDATASLQAQNESMSATIKGFQEAEGKREDAKYAAIAKKYEAIGGTEEIAEVLKAVSKVEGAAEVFKLLDNAVDALAKEEATKEIGTGGQAPEGGFDSMAELESVAKSLQDETPSMTMPQAIAKAADLRPDLVN